MIRISKFTIMLMFGQFHCTMGKDPNANCHIGYFSSEKLVYCIKTVMYTRKLLFYRFLAYVCQYRCKKIREGNINSYMSKSKFYLQRQAPTNQQDSNAQNILYNNYAQVNILNACKLVKVIPIYLVS